MKRAEIGIIRYDEKEIIVDGEKILEGNGCCICSGNLVKIRGRVPGMADRYICPTCVQEKIEKVLMILSPNNISSRG